MAVDNTKQRGIEIVNMLAAEEATYAEAYSILKAAEYELGERKYRETNGKRVAADTKEMK